MRWNEENRIARVTPLPQHLGRTRHPNRIDSSPPERMETGMRPIGYASHPSMSCRVSMDVIHVTVEVSLIADEMFPETSLPKASFTPLGAALRDALAFFDGTGEMSLDRTPAGIKIRLAGTQRPDAM
jgi:hypothetical protein